MEMVFHEQTARQIKDFIARPTHALLIQAPLGAGKHQTAQHIALKILDLPNTETLYSYPYYYEISGTESIAIDTVRTLKNFVQLKTTGSQPFRRIVIIENAEKMTTEAQNALLKILEEPPSDTVFLLTSSNTQALLPTIVSRAQLLTLKKPAKQAVLDTFIDLDLAEVMRAYHMSSGQIGLMTMLLKSDEAHPLLEYIDLAKELLKQSTYERLLQVNELANQNLPALFEALYSVAHAGLIVAIEKNQTNAISHWYNVCSQVQQSQLQLKYKPQSKLLLTHLLANL